MAVQTSTANPQPLVANFSRLSQFIAAGYGVFLVSIAVVGFAVTGFSHFSGQVGHNVLGVGLNPLANLVHLLLGVYALGAAVSKTASMKAARVMFLSNLLLFLYGVYAAHNQSVSILATNGHTNGMHLLLALLAHW